MTAVGMVTPVQINQHGRHERPQRGHPEQAAEGRAEAAPAGRRHHGADAVDEERARHEVDDGPRQDLLAEGEQDNRQAVVPGVGKHHDDEERHELGPVEAERHRDEPRGEADGGHEQDGERADAPELARADPARDKLREYQAGGEGVERHARHGLHVDVKAPRQDEAHRRHQEDGQDVVGQDEEEQSHRE